MSEREAYLYSFGEFYFDAREKTLRRGDELIPLSPKVSEVLSLLVEREGKIVTKNEVMETVWADSFVEESNLTQSVYTLRRILGKDENGSQFIETIPRRGYRFAGSVSKEAPAPEKTNVKILHPLASIAGNKKTDSVLSKNETISQEWSLAHQSVNSEKRFSSSVLLFRLAVPLGSILVIAGIVFAAYVYFFKPAPAAAPVENVVFQKLTFSGDITFPVISPDGKSFAFIRDDNIFLQDIATGSSFKLNVPNHAVFGNLQFSADGETILFRNEERSDAPGDIFQVSRFGGDARRIIENAWSGVGFSPDGKRVSFVRFYPSQAEWALAVKSLESGEENNILSRKQPHSIYHSGFPAWSPDGQRIVTVEQTPNQKNISRLIIVDIGTGATETLETPRFVQIEQTAWLPENDEILIVGRENNRFFQLWKISYPDGELRRITNDLSIYRNLSLSQDGKNLLARQQTIYSHLWTAPADDLNAQKQITFGNLNRDGNSGLTWTTDGENIVYASRITGNVDLWLLRPSDGFRRQLTENSGNNNENPAISSDGKHIYFESTRSGTRHIWRIDSNGENPAQMTFSEKETEFYPAISPAGDFLYYIQRSPRGNVVWRKNLADGKTEMITELGKLSPESFLALSPDGNFLAFNNLLDKKQEAGGQKLQIVVISTSKNSEPRFFNLPATSPKISWTSDGRAFDFMENSPTGARIRRQNLKELSEAEEVVNLPEIYIFDFARSPDGKNFVLSRGKQESDAMLLRSFE